MKMNPEKLKKLQELLGGAGETPPEGYYTMKELGEMMGMCQTSMQRKINILRKSDKSAVITKDFTIKTQHGLRKIPYYKFKGV